MAGARQAAPPAPPALGTEALPGGGVAAGARQVALTLPLAGRCPPARLTQASSGEGVAVTVRPARARELAERSPAIGVARALAGDGVALPMRVAQTALLAVRAPVLVGAACEGNRRAAGAEAAPGPVGSSAGPLRHGRQGTGAAHRRGPRAAGMAVPICLRLRVGVEVGPSPTPSSDPAILTGAAVGPEEARLAAADPRLHTHLIGRAGVLALAHCCGSSNGQLSAALPRPAPSIPAGHPWPGSPACHNPALTAGSPPAPLGTLQG